MSNAGPDDLSTDSVRDLITRYRTQCLWFLREDYFPSTPEETVRVLQYIERHGDREGFIMARRMRQWLQRNSSEESAGS
jgi:hypothetical protein